MRKLGLGLLALVVVYACGETASDMMGGVLEDAGTMLQDAGEQMQDGGAQAQEPTAHDVVCDKTRTQVNKAYDSEGLLHSTTTYRQKYAVLNVPDWQQVGVERCRTRAEDTWVTCPPGSDRNEVSCTGLLQEQGCDYFIGGYHVGSKFYVSCDTTYEFEYTNPDIPDSVTGTTYTRITAYY